MAEQHLRIEARGCGPCSRREPHCKVEESLEGPEQKRFYLRSKGSACDAPQRPPPPRLSRRNLSELSLKVEGAPEATERGAQLWSLPAFLLILLRAGA